MNTGRVPAEHTLTETKTQSADDEYTESGEMQKEAEIGRASCRERV